MGGRAFHCIEDFIERPDSLILLVDKRNEDHVNVIWHYDHCLQIIAITIVMQARVENDFACHFGHDPALKRAEGYEMGFVVPLKMRKATTVKAHDTIA